MLLLQLLFEDKSEVRRLKKHKQKGWWGKDSLTTMFLWWPDYKHAFVRLLSEMCIFEMGMCSFFPLPHSDRSWFWSGYRDGEVLQHQMSCFRAAAKCGGAGCNGQGFKDAWRWPKCKLRQCTKHNRRHCEVFELHRISTTIQMPRLSLCLSVLLPNNIIKWSCSLAFNQYLFSTI